MNVLVLNSGSTSVRFQVIETDPDRMSREADRLLARGIAERLGPAARLVLEAAGREPAARTAALPDHRAAVQALLQWLVSEESGVGAIAGLSDIHAAGHRVVHGGERFRSSVLIDPEVLAAIEACADLAPLHNPANLMGIRAAIDLLGESVPQVAVFDTAFHATLPETSFLYGIPLDLYLKHRIRRYGFHGTSHRYVAERYRAMRGLESEEVDIITLHLGGGCSACAIRRGESWDTSMGFTPLEGLLMGTRSGDIDPSVVEFLARKEGMSLEAIGALLNGGAGLLGLSGRSADMRDLLEAEQADPRARLAIDIFCQRARKYVGAYFAEMGGADAVVFTAGIGENAPEVRRRICAGLDSLGLTLDAEGNARATSGRSGEISAAGSTLRAFVIPTNEELLIARDTVRLVRGAGS